MKTCRTPTTISHQGMSQRMMGPQLTPWVMLLKNLTAASCGTVIITKAQPRYSTALLVPNANPSLFILMMFMVFSLVSRIIMSLMAMTTHHKQMATEHENDKKE